MTGSEKIVARILEEARQAGDRVIADAQEKAARILTEADKQAQEKRSAAAAEAALQAEEIGRAARSAAQLIRRNRLLEERRALLREALERTAAYLRDMPQEAYFRAMEPLICSAAMPGEGLLRFNARDRERLPGDFLSRVNAGLPQGRTVKLADTAAEIDGGFILQYGDIEMNSSFSALMEARREELEDLLSQRLFA